VDRNARIESQILVCKRAGNIYFKSIQEKTYPDVFLLMVKEKVSQHAKILKNLLQPITKEKQ